jgi:hypothetical protein
MNGPERLFESAGGPLAEALKQARSRVADEAKLSQIAGGLARQGVPIDPSAIPASAGAAPGAWSLGAKVTAGVGGVLALVALGTLLRTGSGEISGKAAPGSEAASAAIAAAATATSASQPRAAGARQRFEQPGQPAAEAEHDSEAPSGAPEGTATLESPPAAPAIERDAPRAPLAAPLAGETSVPRAEPAPVQARSGSASSPAAQTGQSFREPSAPAGKEEEIALLKEARAALSASPSQALALTERHRADYPKGALVQERELIAITALARLGQTSSARQRADRFRSLYPRSAYLKQIDRVLGEK